MLCVFVLLSFVGIFALCELGTQVKSQFKTLNSALFQLEWYLLPVELQRMLLIFMMGAQDAVLLRGYGNIECTRDAFKNVSILKSNSISLRLFVSALLQSDIAYRIFQFNDASTNYWINGFTRTNHGTTHFVEMKLMNGK